MTTPQQAAEAIIASYKQTEPLIRMAGGIPRAVEESDDLAVILARTYLAEHPPRDSTDWKALADEIERREHEKNALQKLLEQWQRYASYCRCCAQSGEYDVKDFAGFLATQKG